jgi:hypothetical protein
MKNRHQMIALFMILSAFLTGAGCSDGSQPRSEARLMERAEAYWNALQVRDFSTLYGLEAGSRDGTLTPEQLRSATGRSRLQSFAFKGTTIEEDRAMIQVERVYRVEGIGAPVPTTQPDFWMYVEGDWYHGVPARSSPPGKP